MPNKGSESGCLSGEFSVHSAEKFGLPFRGEAGIQFFLSKGAKSDEGMPASCQKTRRNFEVPSSLPVHPAQSPIAVGIPPPRRDWEGVSVQD